MAGQDHPAPTLTSGEAHGDHHLAQVVRDRTGAGDDIEQDVPLRAEHHQHDGPVVERDPEVDEDQRGKGNSRMAGKLARTCTTGWAKRDSFGLIPIFTPMGTQMSVEMVSRTTTLAKVASPNPIRVGKRAKPEM